MSRKALAVFLLYLILGLSLLFSSCSLFRKPYWPGDTWRTSSPEKQGMDPEFLARMFDRITQGNDDIHSVIIIRNGYLVAEAYKSPLNRESLHEVYKIKSSILSLLTGIVISEGYIDGTEVRMSEFLPYEKRDPDSEVLGNPTIKELLTSTKEDHYYPKGTPDPGSRILEQILTETTGSKVIDLVKARLFHPLGIHNAHWLPAQGAPEKGLYLTPMAMARIGYLMLKEGIWDGKEIVPSIWISESTRTDNPPKHPDRWKYGYHWWVSERVIMAAGTGGQRIFISPEENMVVIFTTGKNGFPAVDHYFADYILPSVKYKYSSSSTLYGGDHLAAALKDFQKAPPFHTGKGRDILSSADSSETFLFSTNPLHLSSLDVIFSEDEAFVNFTFLRPIDGLVKDSTIKGFLPLNNNFQVNGQRNTPFLLRGRWKREYFFRMEFISLSSVQEFDIQMSFDNDGEITLFIYDSVMKKNFRLTGNLFTHK